MVYYGIDYYGNDYYGIEYSDEYYGLPDKCEEKKIFATHRFQGRTKWKCKYNKTVQA